MDSHDNWMRTQTGLSGAGAEALAALRILDREYCPEATATGAGFDGCPARVSRNLERQRSLPPPAFCTADDHGKRPFRGNEWPDGDSLPGERVKLVYIPGGFAV